MKLTDYVFDIIWYSTAWSNLVKFWLLYHILEHLEWWVKKLPFFIS